MSFSSGQFFGLIFAAVAMGSCAVTDQVHSELNFASISVLPLSLEEYGVGVLTPSAPTGQESDRQALGDALGTAILAMSPQTELMPMADKRLSIAGIRMFETWRAQIRVRLEIWDSITGEIARQGNEELTFAREGVKDRPVSFSQVAALATERLVDRVGQSGTETSDEEPEALAAAQIGTSL